MPLMWKFMTGCMEASFSVFASKQAFEKGTTVHNHAGNEELSKRLVTFLKFIC